MGLQSVYSYICMYIYVCGLHLNSKKPMKVESNHNSESVRKNDSEENDDTFDTERVAKIQRHGLG